MIRIAVDAMGGDDAPSAIVDGAVAAARHLDIHISLVGAPASIDQVLARHGDWRSSAKAIDNAIAMACRYVTGGFVQRVEREMAAATVSHH